MKAKLYYGVIALMWLLSGCENGTPITGSKDQIFGSCEKVTIEQHDYFVKGHAMTHAGNCKKCKHELDSIVKVAVKEALKCE